MNRQLVAYANTLSVIVLAQALELEQQRRLLDRNAETMLKCRETIEALMDATFGKVEVFEMEG